MKPLQKLAGFQIEHPGIIVLLSLLLTGILVLGIPKIQLQTDFQDSLPDAIPAVEAQDKVEATFGSQSAIIVLMETDDTADEPSFVSDIRDPRVVRTLEFLEQELSREPIVSDTRSMATLFQQQPESMAAVKERLSTTDASFTNRDYTATTMSVELSEDMTEENIREATEAIDENIAQSPKYPGVDIRTTGTPVVRTTISDILVSDTVRTLAIASLLILGLLVISRGRIYGPITFVPLIAGVIWTLGAMGHLGIPLSFATISLGSMILGLGVEYGSFIAERILEELENGDLEHAIMTAVPNTGKAILGSSATDGIGFLALLLASISFIRDLGITLAMGEFLTVGSALIITPAFIVLARRWGY